MDKPALLTSYINPLFVQTYERYLPTAFDESPTLLEKVNKIIVTLNQIGQLSNDVLDQWNQVMDWVMNDGMDGSISAKLDSMLADGTFDTLINHEILNSKASIFYTEPTLKDDTTFWIDGNDLKHWNTTTSAWDIVYFNTSTSNVKDANGKTIDQALTDFENSVLSSTKNKLGDTFGTYANASIESVIGNNPDAVPQVLGIPLSSDSQLATYGSRDGVASYRAIYSRAATLEVDNVTYTRYTVTLPSIVDLSNIQVGMIIDTKHSSKYSGIITAVDNVGKVITVNNWYQLGNTSTGQVPPTTAGILINPVTTVWGDNVNVFLESGDPETNGYGMEIGMFNNQSDGGVRTGILNVSLGSHKPYNAFEASSSSSSNQWIIGYKDHGSDTAFAGDNSDTTKALLSNLTTGYNLYNDGSQNRIRATLKNSNNSATANTIVPTDVPTYIISNAVAHTLQQASDWSGCYVHVFNITGSDVTLNGTNSSGATTITVPANSMKIIVSDGAYYYTN